MSKKIDHEAIALLTEIAEKLGFALHKLQSIHECKFDEDFDKETTCWIGGVTTVRIVSTQPPGEKRKSCLSFTSKNREVLLQMLGEESAILIINNSATATVKLIDGKIQVTDCSC